MTTELHSIQSTDLKERAEALLASGAVKAVLGWRTGPGASRLQPALFTQPAGLADLRLPPHPTPLPEGEGEGEGALKAEPGLDLAVYLRRAAVRRLFPVAILTRPGDLRSIVVLIQEGQVKAEDVRPLVFDPDSSAAIPGDSLAELLPWLRANYPARDFAADKLGEVVALDRLTPAQRWEHWKEQFSRCLRCYACREACPLCYCERCIVDLAQPAWLEPSAHPRGSLNWNLIRAYHLAGRCTLCGACESACPVDIPLMALNRMLAQHVHKEFGFAPGLDPAAPALLATWRREDPNELFR